MKTKNINATLKMNKDMSLRIILHLTKNQIDEFVLSGNGAFNIPCYVKEVQ